MAVIGGGITGITTALLLKRGGARVAVIEAASVGSGVTGATTAKVTALQSTVLSQIRSRHGEETAAVYAQAYALYVLGLPAGLDVDAVDVDGNDGVVVAGGLRNRSFQAALRTACGL